MLLHCVLGLRHPLAQGQMAEVANRHRTADLVAGGEAEKIGVSTASDNFKPEMAYRTIYFCGGHLNEVQKSGAGGSDPCRVVS